ncbi:hypothetical protein HYG89_05075 [Acinetobacter sp. SwsAc5]|uniref:hypothetical protein n=1 Tax=Acinetobacter sp. SwsAc5 TaxID=2749438 RepID=UPI0015C11D76|nr:hypothetical protein [Acinetobacter sp. SwsAc5]NWK51939.1 hypothetical protein [Acinetobacter sp. SwsAc5]
MSRTSKFLLVSLAIAAYILIFTGCLYVVFSIFGENLIPVIGLLILFSFGLESIGKRFSVESKVQVWKDAIQSSCVGLTIAFMVGSVGYQYVTSHQYHQLFVALIFLVLAALVVGSVIYTFRNVFNTYGFDIGEPKIKKQKKVI